MRVGKFQGGDWPKSFYPASLLTGVFVMFEPNVNRILERLGPADKVLDIGGWARPFNRANYVIDAGPYETRGFLGRCGPPQGGEKEWFSRETWIQRDICDRTPFPFRDKEIDFVICSHTLEDIRDPLWVCAEMVRIGKQGYLEVPSRVAESSRGVEPGMVGWSHYRWLITIEGKEIRFLPKYHTIHSHWRFSFPKSFLKRLPEDQKVQWLFWEKEFTFCEPILYGAETITAELEGFVEKNRPYSPWLLIVNRHYQWLTGLFPRGVRKLGRILRRAKKS
jgi:Methyltransferase domain